MFDFFNSWSVFFSLFLFQYRINNKAIQINKKKENSYKFVFIKKINIVKWILGKILNFVINQEFYAFCVAKGVSNIIPGLQVGGKQIQYFISENRVEW